MTAHPTTRPRVTATTATGYTGGRRLVLRRVLAGLTLAAGLTPVVSAAAETGITDPSARHQGGEGTVARSGAKAFSQPMANSGFEGEALFKAGNAFFRSPHLGEGPLLNARTCQGCHRQDGRGNLPDRAGLPMASALVRLGAPRDGAWRPDPTYGHQLQTFGVGTGDGLVTAGDTPPAVAKRFVTGEARAWVEYEPVEGRYPDGEPYTLRRPIYHVADPSHGPFAEGVRFSLRVAPPVFGTGLLGAIPTERLRALADPDDADGDGVSGRLRRIHDPGSGDTRVGRFGFKGGAGSIAHQSAAAYRDDMGLTSRLAPEESCTPAQADCRAAAEAEPHSHDAPDGVDVSDRRLALVEFYVRHLAVPAARGFDETTDDWEPRVGRGRALFEAAGCVACHTPRHTTGEAPPSPLGDLTLLGLEQPGTAPEALSNQTIRPYTDLLLHDMGGACRVKIERDDGGPVWVQHCTGLADGRPEGNASGSEWRTAPLWGVGLTETVNQRATYLHDGRARTLEEAILWHGGEAEGARERFKRFSRADREALITFLESL